MLKRLIFIVCFFPMFLAAIIVAGLLAWVAIGIWVFTGELPEFPGIGFELLDQFSDWAGV